MKQPIVGMIGLGLMGEVLTRRLIETGHTVHGYDVVTSKISTAARAASGHADRLRRSRAAADIVLMSVTTTATVEQAILGEDGIASAGRLDGKVTRRPLHDRDRCDEARRGGARPRRQAWPSSTRRFGRARGARPAVRLRSWRAARRQLLPRARPVLEHLGQLTHLGPVGAGQATKLVNQTLVLANYCVIAEALRLAEAYGVDAKLIPAALAPGHAGSNLLPVLFERMIARDFAPRGYARQVLKDLEMLHEAAGART